MKLLILLSESSIVRITIELTLSAFAIIALLLLSFVLLILVFLSLNLYYDLSEVYLVNIGFLYVQLLVFCSIHGQGLVVN